MRCRRPRRRATLVLLGALCGLAGFHVAGAGEGDLGVIGPVYPVQEPDLRQAIEARLREQARTGELARLEREGIARAERTLHEPPPIDGLHRARTPRISYFDPSVTLEREARGPGGERLAPAGTRVNPLDHVTLSRPLLFLDARDPDQVRHAASLLAQRRGELKPILVGGSYVELMRRWSTRVYYDQGGLLVARLGIRQVPALVTQEGKRLRIEEIAL